MQNKHNENEITLNTKIVQAKDVVSEELGSEVVMLRVESNAYYSTNDIGAEIWKRIAQPVLVQNLVADLMQEFDVDEEQCAQDVIQFLNYAFDEGTVTIV